MFDSNLRPSIKLCKEKTEVKGIWYLGDEMFIVNYRYKKKLSRHMVGIFAQEKGNSFNFLL